MGALKQLLSHLIEQRDSGSAAARRALLGLGSAEGLRGISPVLDAVADYVDLGLSIVPQLPGAKSPCVRWKPFQMEQPHVAQLYEWYQRWPHAGCAVILGPVSDLFVIDVDGPKAHAALVSHMGGVPKAPRVLSGSGKPYRYHIFFRHPEIATKAKTTPWHPHLEFRGDKGIVVLPPSRHKSGNRYRWENKRSIHDLALPQLPKRIVVALSISRAAKFPDAQIEAANQVVPVVGAARATREFLSGKFAFASNWNSRLFAAACDLAGLRMPRERAMQLLLAGAKPVTDDDRTIAIATIESAYSQPRVAARDFFSSSET